VGEGLSFGVWWGPTLGGEIRFVLSLRCQVGSAIADRERVEADRTARISGFGCGRIGDDCWRVRETPRQLVVRRHGQNSLTGEASATACQIAASHCQRSNGSNAPCRYDYCTDVQRSSGGIGHWKNSVGAGLRGTNRSRSPERGGIEAAKQMGFVQHVPEFGMRQGQRGKRCVAADHS